MSNTWFCSDHHFFHANILKYQPNRGCSSVEEMNELLIHNHNSVVGADDTVYVIGDFIMGHKRSNIPWVMSRLRGNIKLIPGNHDGCWTGNPRREEWVDYYEGCGVDVLPETTLVYVGNTPVIMCHFPYDELDSVEGRLHWARPENQGKHLLHGHIHSLRHHTDTQFNVGVDVNNMYPVSELTILEWIHK